MEPARTKQLGCCLLLALALGGVLVAPAQINGMPNPQGNGQIPMADASRGHGDVPSVNEELVLRQLKRQREEHQKQVFTDTARLVQLATELKAQVETSARPTPSELKDVDEMGKLAKRVSERLRTQ